MGLLNRPGRRRLVASEYNSSMLLFTPILGHLRNVGLGKPPQALAYQKGGIAGMSIPSRTEDFWINYGWINYGETKYTGDTKSGSFVFYGLAGDGVVLSVSSSDGDPVARLLDYYSFNIIGESDDAPGLGYDSLIHATLP